MRLKEEQNAELRLWASSKLENITETDPVILADYAVALLKSDAPIEEVRKSVRSELQGILDENTTQFVAELFVKATSYIRPMPTAPKTSQQTASRPSARNPIPISQAKSALRNAPPLSRDPPGNRKRKFFDIDERQAHVGNHRVTKRGRGNTRGNWGGRGNYVTNGANMQPMGLSPGYGNGLSPGYGNGLSPGYGNGLSPGFGSGLLPGHGNMPFSLPNSSTPPPGVPMFDPSSPGLMAMFPYMAMMVNVAQAQKKQRCDYFDTHGYCMRGELCPHEHVRQAPEFEAQHEIGGYAGDTEQPSVTLNKVHSTPGLSNTPAPRKLSYVSNGPSRTPEEPKEPLTPEEPIDVQAFEAEQKIKQEEHDTRVRAFKKVANHKVLPARKTTEVDTNLAPTRAKLMAKPGGDKTLADITAEHEETEVTALEQTVIAHGIDPDVMSIGGTPALLSQRASSALSNAPALSDTGVYKGRNQGVCRFFLNCTNPNCTFKHAADASSSAILCKYFPNCTNASCTFKHAYASQTSYVVFKFFPSCTRPDCTFKHPGATSNVPCKFYPNCTNAACTFKHGDGGNKSDVDCKYYPDCTNPKCPFKHPEGSSRPGAVKRVDNRPKSLLVSGDGVSLNNGADSMNMVRVAVTTITACESIRPQEFHDPVNVSAEDEAHDGVVVTFAERWQAEEVFKRLTMVGGVGKVKCAWYTGPEGMETPKTELELDDDSIYRDDGDSNGDLKMEDEDVQVKEEDFDVAGEDGWGEIL